MQRRDNDDNAWRALGEKFDLLRCVLPRPFLYGPGRSAFDKIRDGSAKRIVKPGQVFSRIHVDDIAVALVASIAAPEKSGVYNLADDEPSPPQDVIAYACELLRVEPPPLTDIFDASLSTMARSFYADNKRVSNQRMKDVLNVTLQYPTYREGLDAIFKADQ